MTDPYQHELVNAVQIAIMSRRPIEIMKVVSAALAWIEHLLAEQDAAQRNPGNQEERGND